MSDMGKVNITTGCLFVLSAAIQKIIVSLIKTHTLNPRDFFPKPKILFTSVECLNSLCLNRRLRHRTYLARFSSIWSYILILCQRTLFNGENFPNWYFDSGVVTTRAKTTPRRSCGSINRGQTDIRQCSIVKQSTACSIFKRHRSIDLAAP